MEEPARLSTSRYGHDVLLQCEFCVRTRDFVTYALVVAALQYVGMAALIGVRASLPRMY